MALKFEELRVLQAAEAVADGIWKQAVQWDTFARDVVGKQLARAADSVGANIAEAYGRFHYGEKLQFLYYARGSLFEAKYWLNRASARDLMPLAQLQNYTSQLNNLARQLNAFAATIKNQRRTTQKKTRETPVEYVTDEPSNPPALFTPEDLEWLNTIPNT